MSEILKPDLCVIGAGSGGLSVAAGAVQMGASVVLVEKHKMGGDCLNYGCVPSKALLAAAGRAHAVTAGEAFGVHADAPRVDYAAAMDHVADVIKQIEPMDSVERFEGLGCTVIQDGARFTGPREVQAGGKTIRARRFVIATGSSPLVPPIDGLADVPFLTNETLFDNRQQPDHLIIIGGGPIGLEMAQAHVRLGSKVTVLEAASALGKDDPELAAIVLDQLRADGVALHERTAVTKVEGHEGAIRVHAGDQVFEGSHLLVAVGRKPNMDGLGLDEAGVAHTPRGIQVNKGLKTSNKRVYAIGDVTGDLQFTHVANYHAGLVIRSALFRMPVKVNHAATPWATYTAPELAHVGLSEPQAVAQGIAHRVVKWDLAENDRAHAERLHTGLVKIVCTPKGKILGASIVGPHAADLLQPWVLAINQGLKIGAFASLTVPYPSLGEASKRAAGSWYTPTIFSPRVQMIVRLLSKLG